MKLLSFLSASLLVLLLMVPASAETVDWSMGKAIDCPLPPAMPTKALTRTLVFPGGPITEVPAFWTDEQLYIKIIRNTVVMELRDPSFVGTVEVYDDKGNLFLVNVRAAKPHETVDEMLMLRPIGDGGGAAAVTVPVDSDGQITELMGDMVSGRQDPAVQCSLETHAEDGKLALGKRIFADDSFSLELIKVYQGPSLRGYECLMRYNGKDTVRLDAQRLTFPGALAVYASSQVFIDPQTINVEIQPHQAIKIYYVASGSTP